MRAFYLPLAAIPRIMAAFNAAQGRGSREKSGARHRSLPSKRPIFSSSTVGLFDAAHLTSAHPPLSTLAVRQNPPPPSLDVPARTQPLSLSRPSTRPRRSGPPRRPPPNRDLCAPARDIRATIGATRSPHSVPALGPRTRSPRSRDIYVRRAARELEQRLHTRSKRYGMCLLFIARPCCSALFNRALAVARAQQDHVIGQLFRRRPNRYSPRAAAFRHFYSALRARADGSIGLFLKFITPLANECIRAIARLFIYTAEPMKRRMHGTSRQIGPRKSSLLSPNKHSPLNKQSSVLAREESRTDAITALINYI
jgi:hypothetical protein